MAAAAENDNPTWTEFAGFRMVVQFEGVMAEHMAVRRAAGLFDTSHMGRLVIGGKGADQAVERLLTRRTVDQPVGAIRYSLIADAGGRILDDLMVARREDGWLLVVNAANRERVIAQIQKADCGDLLTDMTLETAMFALQGPAAAEAVQGVWPESDAGRRKRHRLWRAERHGALLCASRSGYTGEDGFEIHGPPEAVELLWNDLRSAGVAPCGLGSRDSLRNEAALPLYGHELGETSSPWELGLAYSVSLDKEFIGCGELRRRHEAGISKTRVGLVLTGRRMARQDMAVLSEDRQVGIVTSGTWSPLRERPIAQAFLASAAALEGKTVTIDIRGKGEQAEVVSLARLLPRD